MCDRFLACTLFKDPHAIAVQKFIDRAMASSESCFDYQAPLQCTVIAALSLSLSGNLKLGCANISQMVAL